MPAGETRTFNVHGGYAEGPKGCGGRTGGGGHPFDEKKVGEINLECQHLADAVSELEKAVESLLHLIEPVMARVPIIEPQACDRANRLAPLADRLFDQVLRVQSVTARAQHAANRVEL